jgi:hypothetical protein
MVIVHEYQGDHHGDHHGDYHGDYTWLYGGYT